MGARNGGSTYRCLGCEAELGTVRRTAVLLRTFTPAPNVAARYLDGGAFEVTCSCGRVSRLDWRSTQDRT